MIENYPFLRWFKQNKNAPSLWQKLLPEALMLGTIIVSLVYWPQKLESISDAIIFSLWIVIVDILFALAIANTRTMLLPDKILKPLALAVIVFQISNTILLNSGTVISRSILGGLVVGGIPYLLFQISKGKWIGGGDVKLGFIAGLLLGWKLGLFCIVIFTSIVLLLACAKFLTKSLKSYSRLPTGVLWATVIIVSELFGQRILDIFS